MCLCSELHSANVEGHYEDNQELLKKVQEILTLVYELVDTQNLRPQLPFTLSIKKRQSEADTRTAKIFAYKALDYNTTKLLGKYSKVWEENPSSFWTQVRWNQPKFDDPQHKVLFACLQLDQADAHSRILRRFYTVVCYRLRVKQLQNDAPNVIAQVFYNILHRNDPENRKTLDELVGIIDDLIKAGSRYDALAGSLGIGSLFCLGQDIARTVWEKWLPKDGVLWEKSIKHLKDNGVRELGMKYEKLASKVIANLENSLPRSSCATTTASTEKRSHSFQEPNAKRQRSQYSRDGNSGRSASSDRVHSFRVPVGGEADIVLTEISDRIEDTEEAAGTIRTVGTFGRSRQYSNSQLDFQQSCGHAPFDQLLRAAFDSSSISSFEGLMNPGPDRPQLAFQQSSLEQFITESSVVDNAHTNSAQSSNQIIEPQASEQIAISWAPQDIYPINPWNNAVPIPVPFFPNPINPWENATTIPIPFPNQTNINVQESYTTS